MSAFELIAIEKENTNDVLRSIAKGLRKKYNLNHSGVSNNLQSQNICS